MEGLVITSREMEELANSLNRLTASEQREFQSRMERKQMKEFMGVSAHLFRRIFGTSGGSMRSFVNGLKLP
tara:strand:+ start:218 stop:430 length:213 start_codon:yes stop_codon:yes gene_type:complete